MVRWALAATAVLGAAAWTVAVFGDHRGACDSGCVVVTPGPDPTPAPSAPPALLPRVIEVTDIEPLLDPPALPPAAAAPAGPVVVAVGFEDGTAPPAPVEVAPPPRAVTPVEVAPPPRAVR